MTLETKLRMALARGYCTPENEKKELDSTLIDAMVKETILICKQEIEDAKPKWISVKDKQPQKGRFVLGWIEDAGHIVKCSKTLHIDDELWQYVTHWMPLPESPKEK